VRLRQWIDNWAQKALIKGSCDINHFFVTVNFEGYTAKQLSYTFLPIHVFAINFIQNVIQYPSLKV
jgi:hypothetical protein